MQGTQNSVGAPTLHPPEVVNTWPRTKKYQYILEHFNRILYAYANKMGVDPELISILHGCLLVATTAKEAEDRLALLSRIISYHARICFFGALIVPRVQVDQCSIEQRFWILTDQGRVSPCCMAPRSVDYGVLFYLLLRMVLSLCYDSNMEVRAQALRTLRYIAQNPESRQALASLGVDVVIVHSCLSDARGIAERVQALKLLRYFIDTDVALVTRHMASVLVCIAETAKDDFRRVALDTLRALSLVRPALFVSVGGVAAVVDAALDPQLSEVSSVCVLMLLSLLDHPRTRALVQVAPHIGTFLTYFTDVSAIASPEREAQLQCAMRAVVHMMRSHAGLSCISASPMGLPALIRVLSLPSVIGSVRSARLHVLSLCRRLLSLSNSTDMIAVHRAKAFDCLAQSIIPASLSSSSTRSTSSFTTLPALAPHLNLLHMHLATLLLELIDAGLVEGLAALILVPDAPAQALALLVEVIRLAVVLLPRSVVSCLATFPSLLQHSVTYITNDESNPDQGGIVMSLESGKPDAALRIRALRTLTKLFKENLTFFSTAMATSENTNEYPANIPSLNTCRSAASPHHTTFYAHGIDLGQLLHSVDATTQRSAFLPWTTPARPSVRSRVLLGLKAEISWNASETHVASQLRASGVLAGKDPALWDWNIILALLDGPLTSATHLNAALKTKFLKRLLSFFRPDKKMFLSMAWVGAHALHVKACRQLLRVLLSSPEGRQYPFLMECISQLVEVLHLEIQRADTAVHTQTLSSLLSSQHSHLQQYLQNSEEEDANTTWNSRHGTPNLAALSLNSPHPNPLSLTTNSNSTSLYALAAPSPSTCHSPSSARPSIAANFAALAETGSGLDGFGNLAANASSSDGAKMVSKLRPFGRTAVLTKLSREYIAWLCELSTHPRAASYLTQTGFWQVIEPLASYPTHDYLTRLLILHLDYSNCAEARQLLQQWTVSGSTFIRRTIVHHLHALFLSRAAGLALWAVDILIALLHAPDVQVMLAALATLELACRVDSACLHVIVRRAPALQHLGAFGNGLQLLWLAHPQGVEATATSGWLRRQMCVWQSQGNRRYAELSEQALMLALTTTPTAPKDKDGDSHHHTPTTSSSLASPLSPPSPSLHGPCAPLPPHDPNSPWSSYSLSLPAAPSLFEPVPYSHDAYLAQRLQEVPWRVEVTMDTLQTRSVQLILDTYVHQGFADAGVPIAGIHTRPENLYVCGKDPSLPTSAEPLPSCPARIALFPGEVQGAPATYICGIVLDMDGKPCPFPVDLNSTLRARLSIGAHPPGVAPLSSSTAVGGAGTLRGTVSGLPPPPPPPPSAADTSTMTWFAGEAIITKTTATMQQALSTPQGNTNYVRSCAPEHRHVLLRSHYYTDHVPEIYSEKNSQINSRNWASQTHTSTTTAEDTPLDDAMLTTLVSTPTSDDDPHASGKCGCAQQQCTLPTYSNSSFYYLDGDMRWNFTVSPVDHHQLLLTSVWFRVPSSADTVPAVTTPPHLFAQLARTPRGTALLQSTQIIEKHKQILLTATRDSDTSPGVPPLSQRVSMWALGNIGSSARGAKLLHDTGTLRLLTRAALYAGVLSVRGTAAQVLGFISLTDEGRRLLSQMDWESGDGDGIIGGGGLVLYRDRGRVRESAPVNVAVAAMMRATEPERRSTRHANTDGFEYDSEGNVLLAVPGPEEADSLGVWALDPHNTTGLETVPCLGLDGKPPETTEEDAVVAAAAAKLRERYDSEDDSRTHPRANDTSSTGLVDPVWVDASVRAASKLVLGHISNLCNNVTQRGALTRLRAIKAACPALFRSPYVFAEAYSLLSGHNMRIGARRFVLCELFTVDPWDMEIDVIAKKGSEYSHSNTLENVKGVSKKSLAAIESKTQ